MNSLTSNTVLETSIYTGFWTNWSYGSIQGATITLNNRDGGLLTAFVALFVTFVGRRLWRLFCFVAHMLHTKKIQQDGLYHQRQAILRNAASGLDALEQFVQLVWNQRARRQKSLLRVVPLISISIFMTAAFYVASIFSSRISTATGDHVLIDSSRCGLLTAQQAVSLQDYFGPFTSYVSRLEVAAASYTQQCYMSNTTSPECSIFPKSNIPATVSTNADCPFPGQDQICLRNSRNIRIDTGRMNSHEDFGLNAKPTDRFDYRRVHHCGPLTTDGYSEDGVAYASNDQSLFAVLADKYKDSTDFEVMRYFYGASPSLRARGTNQTYGYPVHATGFNPNSADFVLAPHSYYVPEPDITPIAELQSSTQDFLIVFVSANDIRYLEPVDDDLFSAHKPGFPLNTANTGLNSTPVPTFISDMPATVLGCAIQHQFCNPSTNKCSTLTNLDEAFKEAQGLWSGPDQAQIFRSWYSMHSGLGYELFNVLESLGSSALLARQTLSSGLHGSLPPDQWQQEVLHWHDISMAMMQRAVIEMATGPFDASMDTFVEKLPDAAAKQFCQNQKIRSTSHTSFSVLGLSLTLCLGTLIVLLSYAAEPALNLVQRWRRVAIYRRLEWISNETLQLQRMAHEGIGSGGKWSNATASVPISENGQPLAMLNVTNETHPQLDRASILQHAQQQETEKFGESRVSSEQRGYDNDKEGRIGIVPVDTAYSSPTSDFTHFSPREGDQGDESHRNSKSDAAVIGPSSERILINTDSVVSPTRSIDELNTTYRHSVSSLHSERRSSVDWFGDERIV